MACPNDSNEDVGSTAVGGVLWAGGSIIIRPLGSCSCLVASPHLGL
jgi:hypothetical protein